MSISKKLVLDLKKNQIGDGKMQLHKAQAEILSNFATLFSYPTEKIHISRSCENARNNMKKINSEGEGDLEFFQNYIGKHDIGYLEESYTGIFELNPTVAPYVGYHLFGESYMRSVFLSELKARLNLHNFDYGNELPDHIAVLLAFLSKNITSDLAKELVNDAIRPMLNIVIWTGTDPEEKPDNPKSSNAYYYLFNSLRKFLDKLEGIAAIYPNNDNYNTVKLDVVESMSTQGDGPTYIDQWISKGGKKNA